MQIKPISPGWRKEQSDPAINLEVTSRRVTNAVAVGNNAHFDTQMLTGTLRQPRWLRFSVYWKGTLMMKAHNRNLHTHKFYRTCRRQIQSFLVGDPSPTTTSILPSY